MLWLHFFGPVEITQQARASKPEGIAIYEIAQKNLNLIAAKLSWPFDISYTSSTRERQALIAWEFQFFSRARCDTNK